MLFVRSRTESERRRFDVGGRTFVEGTVGEGSNLADSTTLVL